MLKIKRKVNLKFFNEQYFNQAFSVSLMESILEQYERIQFGKEHQAKAEALRLKKKYVDRGLISIDSIGKVYAASPTWASRIKFFMDDIENYGLNDNPPLALAFTL